jgi:site-specific recombinase XerC
LRDLNYQLKQLCRHNREGSFGTQTQRERQLTRVANQLHELGFRGMNDHSLKPKHVEALIQHWLKTGVAAGTIKNRMSAIRWWARKVNRQNVVARSNELYGIPNRQFVSNVTKAKSVFEADLAKVRDEHVRMSLALQQAFGLRREEAIKFMPGYADRGDHLLLKASWTKGGKERTVPIRTEGQRELLDRAHKLVGRGSPYPRQPKLRAAAQDLRGPDLEGRSLASARTTTCLRPTTLRGIDRVESAGGRGTYFQDTHTGTARRRQGSPTDHQ